MALPILRFAVGLAAGVIGTLLYKDEKLRAKVRQEVDDVGSSAGRIWDDATRRWGEMMQGRTGTSPEGGSPEAEAPPSAGPTSGAAPESPEPTDPNRPMH